jgi:hypothetical protein
MIRGDSSLRSLVHLKRNASTTRTLNLHDVWKRHGHTQAHQSEPFFNSSLLNRSIILKHRLRRNEREHGGQMRSVATKVILPIDHTDLGFGGLYFFVGQLGYGDILKYVTGQGDHVDERDKRLLETLDTLPSLDPFLMRERLKEDGFAPARCYFDLSEADTERIYEFLRGEIEPLIGASFGDLEVALDYKAAKFARKILNNAEAEDMEPLRVSMGMTRSEFEEGLFCWKGFIYYKWVLTQVLPSVRPVADEIAQVRTTDVLAGDRAVYVTRVRADLQKAIADACRTVNSSLNLYDRAFRELALNGQPMAFREFLLQAPSMFYALGERLGAVQHIVSFWRFRFPSGRVVKVASDELADILMDFEASLGFSPAQVSHLPTSGARPAA